MIKKITSYVTVSDRMFLLKFLFHGPFSDIEQTKSFFFLLLLLLTFAFPFLPEPLPQPVSATSLQREKKIVHVSVYNIVHICNDNQRLIYNKSSSNTVTAIYFYQVTSSLLSVVVAILSWHIRYKRLVVLPYVEPWRHVMEHCRQELFYVSSLPEQ